MYTSLKRSLYAVADLIYFKGIEGRIEGLEGMEDDKSESLASSLLFLELLFCSECMDYSSLGNVHFLDIK